jgi:hypothetical protein
MSSSEQVEICPEPYAAPFQQTGPAKQPPVLRPNNRRYSGQTTILPSMKTSVAYDRALNHNLITLFELVIEIRK